MGQPTKDKQLRDLNKLMFVAGFCMNLTDELNQNIFFVREIKKWSKKLFNAFGILENMVYNYEGKKKDKDQFYEEMHNAFLSTENIIDFSMDLDDNQREYFNKNMEQLMIDTKKLNKN
jgi:hypothetical protein